MVHWMVIYRLESNSGVAGRCLCAKVYHVALSLSLSLTIMFHLWVQYGCCIELAGVCFLLGLHLTKGRGLILIVYLNQSRLSYYCVQRLEKGEFISEQSILCVHQCLPISCGLFHTPGPPDQSLRTHDASRFGASHVEGPMPRSRSVSRRPNLDDCNN